MGRAVGEHIDERARATTALARFTAVRHRGRLAGRPGAAGAAAHRRARGYCVMARRRERWSAQLAYVSQGVHPALQTLVRGLGNSGLWLVVSLSRIVESTHGAEEAHRVRHGSAMARAATTCVSAASRSPTGRTQIRCIHELDLVVPEASIWRSPVPAASGSRRSRGSWAACSSRSPGRFASGAFRLATSGRPSLPERRVLIPQEAYVFAGTLLENVTYLRPDAARRRSTTRSINSGCARS